MAGVRIDKWLWAARFFKTRSLAARACELGRIEANGQPAKPAREVRTGDLLQVRNDTGEVQPPKNSVIPRPIMANMPRYSPRKNSANLKPEYSVK